MEWIYSLQMIPPRGCAFVCLTKRKDAYKALDRLKGVKVGGNGLKVNCFLVVTVVFSLFI